MLGLTNRSNGWLTTLMGALNDTKSDAKVETRTKEEPMREAGVLQVKTEGEYTTEGTNV